MMTLDQPRRGWNAAEKSLGVALLCLSFFTMEIAAGSSYAFAGLIALYVLSVMFAIRCQGGLATLFGALIFYYSCQHVIVSQFAKVIFGESPDSRLYYPIPTILSEIMLMVGFAIAGLIGSKIHPNRGRPLFPPIVEQGPLRRLAIVCAVLSILRIVLIYGGLNLGPLRYLSGIHDPLAVMGAIGIAISESHGKKMTNGLVWAVAGPMVLLSLLGAGRGTQFYLVLSLVMGGLCLGYRFKFTTYLLLVLFGLVFFFIVSPYSLVARNVNRTGDLSTNINASIDTFTAVASNPLPYQFMSRQQIKEIKQVARDGYYVNIDPGNLQDVVSRFSLIRTNDLIVDDTFRAGTTGWANITPALPSILPSFLAYDKGSLGSGNALAHRTKNLNPGGDYSTGITLGTTADAFSAFAWWGVLLLPMGGLLLNIVVYKTMVSLELKGNVLALALVFANVNSFSDGVYFNLIQMATWFAGIFLLGIVVAVQLSRLLDFQRLRPRTIPLSAFGEEPNAPTPLA